MATSTRLPFPRLPSLGNARLRERLLRSERVVELCWWYLVCFAATSVAKLAALSSVYRHSHGFVLDEMAASSGSPNSPMPRVLLVLLVLARDVLQSALLSACVFAFAGLFSLRVGSVVRRGVAGALAIVILANHVAFMQLGTFASREVLDTAWGWVKLHPHALFAYFSAGAASLLLLCATAIALPSAMVRVARKIRAIARVNRGLPTLVLTLLLLGSVSTPLAAARFGERAFPVHGYWAEVVQAAYRSDATTPLALKVPSQAALLLQYDKLAFYPPPPEAAKPLLWTDIEARRRPRHMLVVGLETAARAFYPLTSSDELPTFARMTQHAIVSDHHYTTSPYTRIANFSMLSGLYAPPAGLPVRFGPIATDGFASVLRKRGYETSYIDSWVLDWLPGTGERAQAAMLGFDTVIDSAVKRDDGVYEVLQAAEAVAFDTAFERIVHAQASGHKAAVFLGTMLGHGPWPAAKGSESLDSAARLHQIALVFDGLLARMLERLEEHGLGEDVIILVVGDHGLRYAEEFESLGRSYSHSDLSFNVPFMLYAPGLIPATIHLPYATSHVDISPTLLHLVGQPTDGLLYDGGYMLDTRLQDRILYLSNSRLGPLDGVHYHDLHLTYHALSGVAEVGDSGDPPHMTPLTKAIAATLPPPLQDPAALLEGFAGHASLVAGRLLQRGAASYPAQPLLQQAQ